MEELTTFETLVKETIMEIENIEQDVKTKDAELVAVTKALDDAKFAFAELRRAELLKVLTSIIDFDVADTSGASGLLQPLTNEELKLFIQLTCQLSGEMEGSVKEKTCVPLRLAGVDLGILWSDEAFKNASVDSVSVDDDAGRRLYSELVHKNQQGEQMWSKKQVSMETNPTGKRRRLDEYLNEDDDDFHVDHDEYESTDYYDETDEESRDAEDEPVETDEGTEEEKVVKVKSIVEGTVFSRGRMKFLLHADSFVAKLEELVKGRQDEAKQNDLSDLEAVGSDEEDQKVDVEANVRASADADEPVFDSIAYNMAKSILKRRTQGIRRGLQYALSAYIIVDAVSSNDDTSNVRSVLLNLAAATLMHSRASAEHVWGILSTMLPELEATSADDSHSCTSPLARFCPPLILLRSGHDYPPPGIRMAGEAACAKMVDEINPSDCVTEESTVIVTNIPNGYYGYHEIHPRGEDDVFHLVFSPLSDIFPTSVSDLEQRQQALEADIASFQAKVRSLSDTIGGRDHHDTLKGELHAMKNSCFTVTEGKYDYEVCIYGKATQKDKGASSGTSLGKWKGMSIDNESGARVMKWTNGQGCWNGPQRSATVIVKCGAETKLLSADEPDTCSYRLEMESHIACDDAYFKRYLA